MDRIVLGFAPTRRSIFSAPDAVKYRGLTAERLRELGVEFVDIDDINEEGSSTTRRTVSRSWRSSAPRTWTGSSCRTATLGTEFLCARLARDLNVPVLLWGPLDERPEPDGTRLRDTQCGLFATGKVLRRFQVPFTYLTQLPPDRPRLRAGAARLHRRVQRGAHVPRRPHPADRPAPVRVLHHHVQRGRAPRALQHRVRPPCRCPSSPPPPAPPWPRRTARPRTSTSPWPSFASTWTCA